MNKDTVTITVKLSPATMLIDIVSALRKLGLDIRALPSGNIVASEKRS